MNVETCRNGHPRTEANTYRWNGKRACQECRRERSAENRERAPELARASVTRWYHERGGREHSRDYLRAKTYGITRGEFARLLLVQGGACAICRQDEERTLANGERRPLSVDHDHETGAIRGLLCSRCNAGLGLFRDDPDNLTAAAEYIAPKKASEAI